MDNFNREDEQQEHNYFMQSLWEIEQERLRRYDDYKDFVRDLGIEISDD